MSYRTLEVSIEDGRIETSGVEILPARAHGLLTLLDEEGTSPARTCAELAEWWSKRERLPADDADAFAKDGKRHDRNWRPLRSAWDNPG